MPRDKGYSVTKENGKVTVSLEFNEELLRTTQLLLFEIYHKSISESKLISFKDLVLDERMSEILRNTILEILLEIHMEERKHDLVSDNQPRDF